MIFRLFFTKEIKNYEFDIRNLMNAIFNLNSEKKSITENLNFQKKRFERLEYLLNHRVNIDSKNV